MEKDRFNEADFNRFLEDLINSEYLDDKEAGIAKQVLDKGYNSLSKKQKYVLDEAIKRYYTEECKFYSHDISWSEMLDAYVNHGYCPDCKHTLDEIENKD